jgi:hypothetical protein
MDLEEFAHNHTLSPVLTHRRVPTYSRTRHPFTLTITATGHDSACLTVHGLGVHKSAHVTDHGDHASPDDPDLRAYGTASTSRDAALLATFNLLERLCLAEAASNAPAPIHTRPRQRDTWWQP